MRDADAASQARTGASACLAPPRRAVPAAVLFVHDVPRMTAFYRDVFAMREVVVEPGIAVLDIDGMQLTIHGLAAAGTDFRTREDSYLKLCFPVDALAATRARAADLGGALWPASKEWNARGFRACDGRDPEGNVFQVRESQGAMPPTV